VFEESSPGRCCLRSTPFAFEVERRDYCLWMMMSLMFVRIRIVLTTVSPKASFDHPSEAGRSL